MASLENLLSFANTDGEVYIYSDFIPPEHVSLLQKTLQPAPFIHDPLSEVSANARRPLADGDRAVLAPRYKRRATPDSLDDILGLDGDDDQNGFISDDDGAGYAEVLNGFGKRARSTSIGSDDRLDKTRIIQEVWRPRLHEAFQSGSTPWRGNRRYLCE